MHRLAADVSYSSYSVSFGSSVLSFDFQIFDEKFLARDNINAAVAGAAGIEMTILPLTDRTAEAQWDGGDFELCSLG